MRKTIVLAGILVVGLMLAACVQTDPTDGRAIAAAEDTTDKKATTSTAGAVKATKLEFTAVDYAFISPDTVSGGLVEISYRNTGKEPHFAAFAKVAEGRTFDDVKAALTAPPSDAPPSGPPPFTEFAGMPTADAGRTGNMTFHLPAGEYALFCAIASPDGVPHMAKGMLKKLEVTEGPVGPLPDDIGHFSAADFAIGGLGVVGPKLVAGDNVVRFHNQGRQLHEINLVELPEGKTVEDLKTWAAAEQGPPPARFLSGAAVGPGEDATTTLTLETGKTYAFVCMIPDSLGDFAPHIIKGMFTESFEVS
jgi:plastocyanin